MRIAIAGATGRIGTLTIAELERGGHQIVPVSRAAGVDAYTGAGLDAALAGTDAVIDTTNTHAADEAAIVDFFGTTTRNLLAAEERAGVRHHILLSIVGIEHGQQVVHYSGKREQERLVSQGPVPWTIVRVTQFHDFAAMVAGWTERDGVATIAPVLVQPIAQADVAAALADVATGRAAERDRRRGRPADRGPGGHGPPHVRRPRAGDHPRPDLAGRVRRGHGGRGHAARRQGPARPHHLRRLARRRRPLTAGPSRCPPSRS